MIAQKRPSNVSSVGSGCAGWLVRLGGRTCAKMIGARARLLSRKAVSASAPLGSRKIKVARARLELGALRVKNILHRQLIRHAQRTYTVILFDITGGENGT